jgi:hypothetical protein
VPSGLGQSICARSYLLIARAAFGLRNSAARLRQSVPNLLGGVRTGRECYSSPSHQSPMRHLVISVKWLRVRGFTRPIHNRDVAEQIADRLLAQIAICACSSYRPPGLYWSSRGAGSVTGSSPGSRRPRSGCGNQQTGRIAWRVLAPGRDLEAQTPRGTSLVIHGTDGKRGQGGYRSLLSRKSRSRATRSVDTPWRQAV